MKQPDATGTSTTTMTASWTVETVGIVWDQYIENGTYRRSYGQAFKATPTSPAMPLPKVRRT